MSVFLIYPIHIERHNVSKLKEFIMITYEAICKEFNAECKEKNVVSSDARGWAWIDFLAGKMMNSKITCEQMSEWNVPKHS